jgi:hypothetical protein
VVVAGVGVLLVVLLSDDDSDDTSATSPPSATASAAAEEMSGQDVDTDVDLPTGAQVPMDEPDDTSGDEQIAGSTDVAGTFLQALVEGDGDYALELSATDLQTVVEQQAAENGVAPGDFFVAVFYERALGNEEIADAELVSIEYDQASGLEAITVAVSTASTESTLVVYVDEDLLVADLSLP